MDIIGLYLTGTYIILRKGNNSYSSLKSATMIDPVMEWFKITQYDNKQKMLVFNLMETTCMTRYPWTMEITYEGVSERITHKFNCFIWGNIVHTYNLQANSVYQDYPWIGILTST